jgi:carboxymethylenebutenolidase
MAKRESYTAKDGTKLEAEIGEPSGDAKAPAIVIVQEWHGINDHIRSLVDRFAAEGFLAVAPDLYHGTIAKTADEAGKLMNALDKPKAVKEIGDAAAFARAHARSNGKVGVTGFCLGGALAFAAAATHEGLSAVVPFYGLPGMPLPWDKVTAPILAHFAKHDDWATAAGAEEIKRAIDTAKKTTMELHVYDAKHAFMRDSDPATYDAASAKIAWKRTLDFLHAHLG